MPTRRPADAENPPLTDGFGRSIFPEILSARNTGSLAIWFRHHCFVERGARELPLSPHSGNHRQLTTPHGRMQALCKARAKLPPPRHFHRRIRSETRAVLMHRPLTESPIFRVTGWNFSLFCRSIRNLDTPSTMVKTFCSIVSQISVFY